MHFTWSVALKAWVVQKTPWLGTASVPVPLTSPRSLPKGSRAHTRHMTDLRWAMYGHQHGQPLPMFTTLKTQITVPMVGSLSRTSFDESPSPISQEPPSPTVHTEPQQLRESVRDKPGMPRRIPDAQGLSPVLLSIPRLFSRPDKLSYRLEGLGIRLRPAGACRTIPLLSMTPHWPRKPSLSSISKQKPVELYCSELPHENTNR